jgi:hypothetical protein
MLRITVQHSPEAVTFLVEGKLIGQWAKELEQSWEQTSSVPGHRALIIDLTETLFIDEEGRRVLAKLFRAGAFFRTACPMIEAIVSEITGKRKHVQRGAVLPAILLALVATLAKAAPPAPLRLTLHDEVEMALKQNPQVQIANLNVAAGQENQTIARSALLPQANLAVSEAVQRGNLDAAKTEVDVVNLGVDLAREEVTQARDRFQAGVAQDELARANDNQIIVATGQMESLYAR